MGLRGWGHFSSLASCQVPGRKEGGRRRRQPIIVRGASPGISLAPGADPGRDDPHLVGPWRAWVTRTACVVAWLRGCVAPLPPSAPGSVDRGNRPRDKAPGTNPPGPCACTKNKQKNLFLDLDARSAPYFAIDCRTARHAQTIDPEAKEMNGNPTEMAS